MRKPVRCLLILPVLVLTVCFCAGWAAAPVAMHATAVHLEVPLCHTVSISVQYDGWAEAVTAAETTEIHGSGSISVEDGGTLTLIFHPGTGSALKSVRLGETELTDRVADGQLVLENIRGPAEITVVFERQTGEQPAQADPAAPSVKTGDRTPYGIYAAVCLLSAAALAIVLRFSRKRNL
ncbi:MAG: hypothetical protein ACI4GO_10745 [Hominenteromicrobium sp.]